MIARLGRVEFGGPDLPPRRLRDLLQDHIDRAPPGSRIDWATYYFRDRALAEALIRASDRGVAVRLLLEPSPRRDDANRSVMAMLQAHGLGGGFRLYSAGTAANGHLHAKIYAFSEPEIAWVGSFNPSGDEPEDPEVVAEIGDQDRGDNLLLGIERPRLVDRLRRFIDELADPPSQLGRRWALKRGFRDADTRLYFYPRLNSLTLEPGIALLPRSGSVRGAISHLKRGPVAWALARAARRGAAIELLVHDTERRVSPRVFSMLERAGTRIRRVSDPDGLPMHAKFLLVDNGRGTRAWLGSYNFNERSRRHNAEVLLSTEDRQVVDQLSARFALINRRSAP